MSLRENVIGIKQKGYGEASSVRASGSIWRLLIGIREAVNILIGMEADSSPPYSVPFRVEFTEP